MTGFSLPKEHPLRKPIVTFGQVSGYDNPLVQKCEFIDKFGKKGCIGQFCKFWERCGMRERVLILKASC